jgi:hypothetical protein
MSGYDFCPGRFYGEAPTHHEALCGLGAGLRVAITLWLPQRRQRNRLTKAAMGVVGAIARRDSVPAVKTPTWPQLRH